MSKHIFISDIHLGSPLQESHDDLLDIIVEKCDNLFLIGDIIDVWEDKLEDIIDDRKNNMIISSINMISELIPVYIVRGNHDPSIKELKKVFPKCRIYEKLEIEINGDKYILIHGHQFDDLIIKYSLLAKILFILYWICGRFNLNLRKCLKRVYHSISNKSNKSYYYDLVDDVDVEMIKKYQKDYDVVVSGHTHCPRILKNNNIVYINCGDWIENNSYVVFEGNKFKIIKGYKTCLHV